MLEISKYIYIWSFSVELQIKFQEMKMKPVLNISNSVWSKTSSQILSI